MKTLVITGATSFIGKAVIKAANEWSIIAIVRENSNKAEDLRLLPNVKVIELSMENYDQLGKKTGPADCFLHLAWDGTRGANRMNTKMQELNYKYGMLAIKSMVDVGCKRILTAGSQAEYGNINGVISEETKPQPNTEYGRYKLKLFEFASELCGKYQISYKEPRIFSIYGPGDYENTLVMSLIKKMKDNEMCNMTAGTQKWDYLYIDDAAQGILMLCDAKCPDGAYNIASGDIRPLRDYIEEMKDVLNSQSLLCFGTIPYPETGVVSIEPCIERLKKETSWEVAVAFKSGIAQTYAVFQSLLI